MSKFFAKLKKNIGPVISSRVFILTAVFIVMTLILLGRIFYLQIINGEEYLENFKLKINKTQSIKSTRGNIYDRNGNLLAYNELSYTVTIEDNGAYDNLTNKGKNDAINGNIRTIMEILDLNGDTASEYVKITLDESGNYEFTQEPGTSRNRFIADVYGAISFDDLDKDEKNSSAEDIMDYLCNDRYDIDMEAEGKAMALRIVNIRYAMSQTSYSKYLVTTVAQNVSDDTVTMVKENSDTLIGVDIATDYIRQYVDPVYFSSIIGYTGVMSSDEYDELAAVSDQYEINDIVGKAGIEQYMDLELRGQKGEKTFYVDSVGTILQTTEVIDPVAGSDLYLTIDHDLQVNAYKILEQELAGIICKKLIDQMEYDPHVETTTYNIKIPIGDVYVAMIDNAVLDMDQIAAAPAGSSQSELYAAFTARQASVIDAVIAEIRNPSGIYTDLGDDMRAYQHYISTDLLTSTEQIIDKSVVDTSDATYIAWNEDGSMSFRDYLNYAISKEWIDLTKLQDTLGIDKKYASSNEIIEAILTYLAQKLYTDDGFSKLIYKYLILDETISPVSIALSLYEQGVLEYDEATVNAVAGGSMSTYQFFYTMIQNLKITPAQLALEPCTGSIVVTDPNNGQVLALVSYPGYDNNRLSNDMDTAYYNKLVQDQSKPLYNYATQEKTAPGSTYKMVTTAAGQEEGIVGPDTEYECGGQYYNISPNPKCWIYPDAHGKEDNVGAIRDSCNCFFFDIGYQLGLDENGNYSTSQGIKKLAEYAAAFGLDTVSGVQLQESEPQISDSDSVRSAIGQGTNNYTNTQMARYVTTVANRGTLYNLTLLQKTVDADGTIVTDYESNVADTLDYKESTWDVMHEGMAQMVESCSQLGPSTWMGLKSAGKTGTAEQSSIHPDNVMYVGFAPVENPEIAFSIRIANGYTSAYTADVADDLLKVAFGLCDIEEVITGTANAVGTASAGD